MEPVVYREEVLTIMGVLGDIRLELVEIHDLLLGWRAESDANLRRLRELVDRGWAELEERRRREPATDA